MNGTASRLKTLREAKGWNVFQLCVAAKVPEQNIRRYEKGFAIGSPDTAVALARALDTSVDFLLTGADSGAAEKAAS